MRWQLGLQQIVRLQEYVNSTEKIISIRIIRRTIRSLSFTFQLQEMGM